MFLSASVVNISGVWLWSKKPHSWLKLCAQISKTVCMLQLPLAEWLHWPALLHDSQLQPFVPLLAGGRKCTFATDYYSIDAADQTHKHAIFIKSAATCNLTTWLREKFLRNFRWLLSKLKWPTFPVESWISICSSSISANWPPSYFHIHFCCSHYWNWRNFWMDSKFDRVFLLNMNQINELMKRKMLTEKSCRSGCHLSYFQPLYGEHHCSLVVV